VAREQEREHVRADLPPDALADLLLDAIEGGLIRGLVERGCEAAAEPDALALEDHLRRAAQARIDLVLDGARKRNERVRPPARSR
jgi:hypothetical protein